jgi:hypothetical protein
MKYTNPEHTQATHGNSSGPVADLLRLGYVTQDDIDNAEPFETQSELVDKQVDALVGHLEGYANAIARDKGYPSYYEMRTLHDSTVPRVAAEAQRMRWLADELVLYRDAVVASGTLPTLDELAASHPKWDDYPGEA